MTVNYYQFIPCCKGREILFFSGDPDVVPTGVYEYQGQCYTIVYIFAVSQDTLDPVPVDDLTLIGDCEADECLCCQCVRVRTKAPLQAPVGLPARDCSGGIVGISVPADGSWSEKQCLRSWDVDEKQFEVEILGDCIDNECPVDTCFLLEDCEGIQDDIYATYASMSAYIDNPGTIKIDGFPNTCWNFREVDTCECAVEVTVVSTWADCEECITCKGYKLTNCEDPTYIKYTTNDLAAYVGKTVEFENCPGCWSVSCMEEIPPNDQDLVPLYQFDSCKDCLSTFWKLTACTETPGLDPIFTDTDLSAYVGFILTLDGISDTCWQVEEVRDLEGNTFETVFVNTYYEDCVTCLVDIKSCHCTSAVNALQIPTTLTYTDCNGIEQETPTLGPGVRSPRVCAIEWSTVGKKAKDIEYYGDCIEGPVDQDDLKTWDCPPTTTRVRSVRPGYDTPGCPADYFDKVSCKFAEAMYKEVLAERYGIVTNCSTEESRKWEIKKELLNLAAILNPDYECPPVPSGCYDPCIPNVGFVECIPEEPIVPRCMSYLVERDPGFFSQLTVTYRDCNGEEVVYQEYWGESYLCYQFCALEEPAPVATILPLEGPNQGVPEDYVFDEPTRECTDTDADVCLTLAYINGTPGESGEISYVNCAGEPSTYVVTNYNPEEPPILCIAQGSEYSSGPGLGGKFIISDPEGGSALPCRC
jgi:hypothetical protein